MTELSRKTALRLLLIVCSLNIVLAKTGVRDVPDSTVKVVSSVSQLIPEDAFSRKALPWRSFFDRERGMDCAGISWPVWLEDGDILLQFSPTQVYVRSSHNNPNPNRLFWFAKLDRKQYEEVVRYLATEEGKKWDRAARKIYVSELDKKKVGENLIKPFLVNWDGKYKMEELEADFWAKLYCNINLILTDLNAHLPKDVGPIPSPDGDFVIKKRWVYISDDF